MPKLEVLIFFLVIMICKNKNGCICVDERIKSVCALCKLQNGQACWFLLVLYKLQIEGQQNCFLPRAAEVHAPVLAVNTDDASEIPE